MTPLVTVLQLDTAFPRLPGDVASPRTYCGEIEIIRVPRATVQHVVSDRPDLIDITPFEDALDRAKGNVIVTSCGFLSYWQDHLAARVNRPFISSALSALETRSRTVEPDGLLTLTFDADNLTDQHFGPYADYRSGGAGLRPDMHLRQVIAEDRSQIDRKRAEHDVVAVATAALQPSHCHVLLECTNLPPYKAALRGVTDLPITDILTCIETIQPDTIQPRFLI